MKSLLLMLIFTISSAAYSDIVALCKSREDLISTIISKKRYNYSSVNKIYNVSKASKCEETAHDSGMTQIIVQSLILDFVRTMKVAGKDKRVENFVVKYVNASANAQDLGKVLKNAITICPREKTESCHRIAEAAKSSIK